MTGPIRIGELARRTGLSPDSLRHYERLGLLTSVGRTPAGQRLFHVSAERQVRVVQAALSVGFGLDELAGILAERRRGGVPCRRVRALAGTKLTRIEEELRLLRRTRTALRDVLRDWDVRLAGAAPGAPSGLLQALAERLVLPPRRPRSPRRTRR